MKTSENLITWIPVPTPDGYQTIEMADILYMKARNRQTIIFLAGLTTEYIISNEPLQHYEEILKEKNFLRIHNSYIINLKYLNKFLRGKVAYALLIKDISLTVTDKYRDTLVSVLERLR
ncbi:MAG: LytTR family DNA-binding domain-containing protein [Bacteroidota bacterium]